MGFAALWILFFHDWQKVFFDGRALDIAETYVKQVGCCGVDIFLFLSGMGLVYSIGKGTVLSFYCRRLKKIVLPFIVVAVVQCGIENWGIGTFIKNILCINFYAVSVNSFLWFIPAILTLYLMFPLYWKIFCKASDKLLFTGAVLLIWMALSLFLYERMRGDLYGFTNRIPIFIFGVYVGWLTKYKKVALTGTAWFMLVVCFVCGFYFAYLGYFGGMEFIVPVSRVFFPNLLIAVSSALLLAKLLDLLCGVPKAGVCGRVIVKVLEFFGMFSLELYCVQELLGTMILFRIYDEPPLVKNLVIFTAVVVVAFGLYLVGKYFWRLAGLIYGKFLTK